MDNSPKPPPGSSAPPAPTAPPAPAAPPVPPEPPVQPYQPMSRGPQYRTPLIAGILSVVPGLGNIYNGLYQRGITFFVIVVGLFSTAVRHEDETLALLIPAMGFFWLFNIFDAYRQATLINYGYTEPALAASMSRTTSGGLTLGVTVFLVGLYGLLREVFDFDFTVILDYWYLGFRAFGAWLIFQGFQQKKTTPDTSPEDDIDPGAIEDIQSED